MAARRFQNPKGTRDFYPQDMLRRRYVTEAWRAVSLRHGFEEIDGPTFEHLDLYTVKSGEEIVSQLFSFRREGGEDTYALRPEFTPTLARMYAEKANTLAKPVRWFSVLPYFRAEKPQRGRLREFLQWNCDVIGGGNAINDDADLAEAVANVNALLGLTPDDVVVKFSDRRAVEHQFDYFDVPEEMRSAALAFIDSASKKTLPEREAELSRMGLSMRAVDGVRAMATGEYPSETGATDIAELNEALGLARKLLDPLADELDRRAIGGWGETDIRIVRGLAYYTGTVFEVVAEGERAIAGGGRYDNLIELLGGPPTPAVGFAMGDVVLTNLLDDKGLMPTAAELPDAVESMLRAQRVRPEVFVVSGAEENDAHVVPLVAHLRRGVERDGWSADARPWQTDRRYAVRPLHARTTDKSTRNLKKLLADAEKQGARYAAVMHAPDKVQLKDLDAREDLPDSFSIDPESDRYVGRVVAARLDERGVSV